MLANVGLGSRREIERWVAEGRITIDGRVAKLGEQLPGRERVYFDGRPVTLRSSRRPGSARRASSPITSRVRRAARLRTKPAREVPRPQHGRWIDIAPLDREDARASRSAHHRRRAGASASCIQAPVGRTGVRGTAGRQAIGGRRVARALEGVDIEDGRAPVSQSVDEADGSGSNAWHHLLCVRPAIGLEGRARGGRARREPRDSRSLRPGRARGAEPRHEPAALAGGDQRGSTPRGQASRRGAPKPARSNARPRSRAAKRGVKCFNGSRSIEVGTDACERLRLGCSCSRSPSRGFRAGQDHRVGRLGATRQPRHRRSCWRARCAPRI